MVVRQLSNLRARIDMTDTPDERRRLEALERYAILDTPPEAAFDRIVELAAQLLGTPMAAISLVDRHRQWFKARLGVAASETAREIAFCDHTIRSDDVLVVSDATRDPRFKDNPYVQAEAGIRFYAAAPLTTADGSRIGALCVFDRVPRAECDSATSKVLQHLAAIVVEMLEMRLAGRQLAAELRARQRAEERLRLVNAIGSAGSAAPDFSTSAMAMLQILSRHLAADGAQVWSLAPGMTRCELEAAYVAPGSGLEPFMEQMRQGVLTPANSIVGRTIARQQVRAVINAPEADLQRLPYAKVAWDHGVLSFVSMPFQGARTGFALTLLFKKVHPELKAVEELIREMSGEVQAVLARKEAEERLRQAERMEAVGQLTAGVAHVLNNMLTVAMGNIDQASSAGMDDDARRYLARALKSCGDAARFIEQLLAFSQRNELYRRAIDINHQIGSMLRDGSWRAATRLSPDLWPVRADPHSLRQALAAVLQNAREASRAEAPVQIVTRNLTLGEADARRLEVEAGDYAAIEVTDSGSGMSRETAARACEPFFTTKDPALHHGLGLSQVHGFVRQAKGAIEFEGGPEGGTRVRLLLPRAMIGD
jgi:signal transduction histidine kinase